MADIFDELAAGATTPPAKTPAVASPTPAATPAGQAAPPKQSGDIFDQMAAGTYKDPSTTNNQSKQPNPTDYSEQNGTLPGVVRALKNMYHMPGQLLDAFTQPAGTDEEKHIADNGIAHPNGFIPGSVALPLYRLVVKPMEEAHDKGDQYEQMAATETDPKIKKQLLDAAGTYKGASYIPFVGAPAAQLAERAAYGKEGPSKLGANGSSGWGNTNADDAGALSEGVTYVATPELLAKGLGTASKALTDYAVKPRSMAVGDASVPVRPSIENPNAITKGAELVTDRNALKDFDINQTQPAAREAINTLAKQQLLEPSAKALTSAERTAALNKFLEARGSLINEEGPVSPETAVKAHGDSDQAIRQAQEASLWQKSMQEDFHGNFEDAADAIRQRLKPMFDKAGQAWETANKEYQAARTRGDLDVMEQASADKKAAFEAANGNDTQSVVNRLYSKLDDIDKISREFEGNGVVKNTPVEFLKPGVPDPGIIDGAALRRSVRKLDAQGVFKNAGISPQTVQQLQDLGAILERSAVKDPTMFSKIGDVIGHGLRKGSVLGGVGTVAAGHPLVGGSVLAAYGASKLLGHLMTHPDVLRSALQVAGRVASHTTAAWGQQFDGVPAQQ